MIIFGGGNFFFFVLHHVPPQIINGRPLKPYAVPTYAYLFLQQQTVSPPDHFLITACRKQKQIVFFVQLICFNVMTTNLCNLPNFGNPYCALNQI